MIPRPQPKRTWQLAAGVLLLSGMVFLINLARARTNRSGQPHSDGAQATTAPRLVAPRPVLGRDSLRPIDLPEFASITQGVALLEEDDWVISVQLRGTVRAYPLWILSQREIVNDQFGEEPVCITYCPLSATAAVFRAQAAGSRRTFGNDGQLHECNLVLFDRESGSRWYQLGRVALDGSCAGIQLTLLPAPVVRWSKWRSRHPEGEVLVGSRDEGRFFRALSAGPPPTRFGATNPFAPVSRTDDRLPPMLPVTGFQFADQSACIPIASLSNLPPGELRIPGMASAFTLIPEDGIARIQDPDGTVEVPLVEGYWFAWSVAHPGAAVIRPPDLSETNPAPAISPEAAVPGRP